ncbi:hypothetical protein MASR1M49_20030 [Pararhodobacter aggregans]
MRLAGTCSRYSKKAMPQLIRMTVISGALRYFRCPYQAKVMKTFEASSNKMVCSGTDRGMARRGLQLRSDCGL